jgi:hypothetical protein
VGEIGFPVFEAVKMVQTQAQNAGGRQDVVLRRDETSRVWACHLGAQQYRYDGPVGRRTVEYNLFRKEKFWVTTRPIHKLTMVVSMEKQQFENE